MPIKNRLAENTRRDSRMARHLHTISELQFDHHKDAGLSKRSCRPVFAARISRQAWRKPVLFAA